MAITTLSGASGSDFTTLVGSELADSFTIESSKLFVDGQAGNDTVTAAGAIDGLTVETGGDNDTATFGGEALNVSLKLDSGNDTVSLQDFSGTIYGSSGQDTINQGSNRTITGGLIRGDEGNEIHICESVRSTVNTNPFTQSQLAESQPIHLSSVVVRETPFPLQQLKAD